MFKSLKNIDTAFKYSRLVSLAAIAASVIITTLVSVQSYNFSRSMQDRMYVLINGKAFEAVATSREENIPVEAKDHIETFHYYFFTFSPDDKAIRTNITKALYLADNSAKQQYDNLSESNYYSNIVSGNVNQTIVVDSTKIDLSVYPYYFRCFAKQELTRPTSVVIRNLITEGFLRNVNRSENNSHGFLIERWKTIDNSDLSVKNRN